MSKCVQYAKWNLKSPINFTHTWSVINCEQSARSSIPFVQYIPPVAKVKIWVLNLVKAWISIWAKGAKDTRLRQINWQQTSVFWVSELISPELQQSATMFYGRLHIISTTLLYPTPFRITFGSVCLSVYRFFFFFYLQATILELLMKFAVGKCFDPTMEAMENNLDRTTFRLLLI